MACIQKLTSLSQSPCWRQGSSQLAVLASSLLFCTQQEEGQILPSLILATFSNLRVPTPTTTQLYFLLQEAILAYCHQQK